MSAAYGYNNRIRCHFIEKLFGERTAAGPQITYNNGGSTFCKDLAEYCLKPQASPGRGGHFLDMDGMTEVIVCQAQNISCQDRCCHYKGGTRSISRQASHHSAGQRGIFHSIIKGVGSTYQIPVVNNQFVKHRHQMGVAWTQAALIGGTQIPHFCNRTLSRQKPHTRPSHSFQSLVEILKFPPHGNHFRGIPAFHSMAVHIYQRSAGQQIDHWFLGRA